VRVWQVGVGGTGDLRSAAAAFQCCAIRFKRTGLCSMDWEDNMASAYVIPHI
jgi:hypothetical protein